MPASHGWDARAGGKRGGKERWQLKQPKLVLTATALGGQNKRLSVIVPPLSAKPVEKASQVQDLRWYKATDFVCFLAAYPSPLRGRAQ
jgi:hypothetical protein